MKYCPECQANVEGLIEHCDCCGASLKPKTKRFFVCGIFELPQCLYFSSLIYEMLDAIQPKNPEKYKTYLEQVGIRMVCYPEWILDDGNIKNRLRYYKNDKYASLTVIVDYREFVMADKDKKAYLVANALLQGILLLQARLHRDKICIDDIVAHAFAVLNKYLDKKT